MNQKITVHFSKVSPFLIVVLLLTSQALAIESLPEGNPKYKKIKTIYDSIWRAFGDGREAPDLIVKPINSRSGRYIAAYYNPSTSGLLEADEQDMQEGFIGIDEKTYDLLASFGEDHENALAVLVGHELTHFYLRHGWVGDFGSAFAENEIGEKMVKAADYEETGKYETEADFFGGFYGYVAGYDTLGIAPKVLDMIYTNYELPEKMKRYPSRAERKAIAEKNEQKLRQMVPIFDAANRLLLLKRYEEAARLFDYMATSFPSREIFNNAGVARVHEALSISSLGTFRFAYPLEFDAETRLHKLKTKGKGYSEEDIEERRKALLEKATENFEKAIRQDKGYATAYVNSAVVYEMLGEREKAVMFAGDGVKIAKAKGDRITLANALIVRGIAYAGSDQKGKAVADLEEARQGDNLIASLNLSVLQDEEGFGYAAVPSKGKEKLSPKREKIGDLSASDENLKLMEDSDTGKKIKGKSKDQPDIKIFSKQQKDWEGMVVDIGGDIVFTISTPEAYSGLSARGVRTGSDMSELKEKYGEPARVISARQENYYFYEGSEIIFRLDRDNKVSGWMIFGMYQVD